MFNLPKRALIYRGGFSMLSRKDDPKYQCTSCYKPFFQDEVIFTAYLAQVECPNCLSPLRVITDSQPLITK